jgi:putative acetyltransferase
MIIRETTAADTQAIWDVEKAAFGSEVEPRLVQDLLVDPTAAPFISLLAFEEEKAVGHILLTRVVVQGRQDLKGMILAPMAVLPDYQRQGVGKAMIRKALEISTHRGIDLVFVLGHIAYYPNAGFKNDANALGFEPPYRIEEKNKDAWMAQELRPGIIGHCAGKVVCAEKLMKPELWRE